MGLRKLIYYKVFLIDVGPRYSVFKKESAHYWVFVFTFMIMSNIYGMGKKYAQINMVLYVG